LVKTGVNVPGLGKHDIVYVATEHDSVYAFDANTLAPIWHDSFINPAAGVTTVSAADVQSKDVGPEVGITGTPVIDPASKTLYVVSKEKVTAPTGVTFEQKLHALDLATGAEKFGGPVVIQATVAGNGDGSVGGQVSFDPLKENQRTGLTLSHGVVYMAFASYGDNGPFHGWVLGYNARTLRPALVYNDTANGQDGGIWMSGGAIAADPAGLLYLATGNGTFDPQGGTGNFGDSVLKLKVIGRPAVAGSFTPANQADLQANDIDLGSSGVVLLPDRPGAHKHLLVAGGKDGTIFLLDRDNLGGFSAAADNAVQEIPKAMHGVFDTPAYYNGTLYYVGAGVTASDDLDPAPADHLQAFSIVNGRIDPTPAVGSVPYNYPGATPSVSANGATGGIVWTIDKTTLNTSDPAVLVAYDAADISHILYTSAQAGTRDQGGPFVKFSVPTVANGKVFVGGNGTLTEYGLFAPPVPTAARVTLRPRAAAFLRARHRA
jgi:hypothetical protein